MKTIRLSTTLLCIAFSISTFAQKSSFETRVTIDASIDDVVQIAVGDVNNDQKNDVVVAANGAGKILWYQGNGDNTFSTAKEINASASGASAVAIADVDKDGKNDVVFCSATDGKVGWHKSNGDGTFGNETIVETVNDPEALAVGDFNGDGYPELVVGYNYKVVWYSNNAGVFQAAQTLYNPGVNVGTIGVGVGDFDGDGKKDIAYCSVGGSTFGASHGRVVWHAGDGNGAFGSENVLWQFFQFSKLRVYDLNNDGYDEIFTIDQPQGIVGYFDNKQGTLSYNSMDPNSHQRNDVFAINTDADSELEVYAPSLHLIVDNQGGKSYDSRLGYLSFNTSDHSLSVGVSVDSTASDFVSPYAIAGGDMDGDGDMDLVLSIAGTDDKLVYYENKTAVTTGVTNLSTDKMEVYPNPVSDDLFLNIGSQPYALYSVLGDLKMNGKGSQKISVGHLPKGVYLLMVNEGMKNRKVFRIVKK